MVIEDGKNGRTGSMGRSSRSCWRTVLQPGVVPPGASVLAAPDGPRLRTQERSLRLGPPLGRYQSMGALPVDLGPRGRAVPQRHCVLLCQAERSDSRKPSSSRVVPPAFRYSSSTELLRSFLGAPFRMMFAAAVCAARLAFEVKAYHFRAVLLEPFRFRGV